MTAKSNEGGALPRAPAVALTSIVKERPIDESPLAPGSCPYCNAANTRSTGVETTLLGWAGEGFDPNHKWDQRGCDRCGQPFVRESKDSNVWYTADRVSGRVLRGMPSCFERYVYSCALCGAAVHRRYTNLDGSPLKGCGLLTTAEGPQYRAHYDCAGCGWGGFTERDYWRPDRTTAQPARSDSGRPPDNELSNQVRRDNGED